MARWPFALAFLILGGVGGAFLTNSALQGQSSSPPAPVFPKELSSYREVVKVVLPAVVSIQAEPKKKEKQGTTRRRPSEEVPGSPEELFRRFFQDRGFDFEMPDEIPHQSFGSGFIIDPKGVILTNFHVVSNASRVKVALKDGTIYTSTDIKGDRKNDLAIVRIDPKSPLPYLELGDSDAMEVGDRVLAVGAPFQLTGSVTAGIVSAKGRSGLNMERTVYEDYLQTDAAINPGNSGGPLVNLEGKVIGVNTAIKTGTGGFQGVGLAITSNIAKNIANQLIHGGVVHRGYLGVSVASLDPEVAARIGAEKGVLVSRVMDGSPAEAAGVRESDVITSVAGKSVNDGRELQRIVGGLAINKPVEIGVIRDGKSMVMEVTIKEQPDNYGLIQPRASAGGQTSQDEDSVAVDNVGITVADLTPELAARHGYKEDAKGVVVTEVQTGSVASEAGLTKGLLIMKIDKKPVASAAAAKEMFQKARLESGILVQFQLPTKFGGGIAYRVLKAEPANK
jgi:serine protease Do